MRVALVFTFRHTPPQPRHGRHIALFRYSFPTPEEKPTHRRKLAHTAGKLFERKTCNFGTSKVTSRKLFGGVFYERYPRNRPVPYELYELMNGMPLREMDQIVYPVCTLCRDHERSGFIHGVQVGIRLAEELK